jgi:hypothetical protein
LALAGPTGNFFSGRDRGDLGEVLLHDGTDSFGGGRHGILSVVLASLAIGVI